MLQTIQSWIWLQRSQWKSEDELAKIQSEKLKRSVEYAYENVPFYRNLYSRSGLSPSDLKGLDSFKDFPMIDRDQYRLAPLLDRTSNRTNLASCRRLLTSGTTGKPLTVLVDPDIVSYRDALNLRLLWAYGIRPFDRVCRISGYYGDIDATNPVNRGIWETYRRSRYKLLLYSGNIQEHLDFFSRWKPTVLIVPGSYCRTLMDECDAANKTLRFKVVITTAELPDNATRSLIQEKFRAEVYDHYGLEEVGPVAWECPTREGYHLNSESLLIEVMKDGRPVREDEPGELYVSSLYQMATPMLRYNTEDRATLSSDRCPCGRGLARLKSIEGRSFDFVLTSDGHRVSPILIMGTLESANGVEQYRLIQNTDSSIDVLVVAKQVGSETIIQELTSRCNLLFGNTIVRIKLVNKIDVKTRKFRFIESHVTHS